MEISIFESNNYKFDYIKKDGQIWFRGKPVAEMLGYADTAKAIRKNVDEDEKQKL